MMNHNYTKNIIHGFIKKIFAVFVVLFSLFPSAIVFAATACPGSQLSVSGADNARCMQECQSRNFAWGGLGSANNYTPADKCCCIGAGLGPSSSSGGSRAVTPGAATPVTSGSFSYDVKFDNPLGGACSNNQAIKCSRDSDCGAGNQCQNVNIPVIAGNVIRYVLGIIGSVALVIFLYGGIQWMIATGDDTRVKKGLDTMIWAGLGLVIIFGSYVAAQFLLTAVLGS